MSLKKIHFLYNNGKAHHSLLLSMLIISLLSACSTSSRIAEKGTKHISAERQGIIEEARKYLGVPYKYAGKNPKGFDCSGFTQYVFGKSGIALKGSSDQQYTQGKKLKINELKPGDLVFFGKKKKISHVGIVVRSSNGSLVMIHSSSSRGIVEEEILGIDYWNSRILDGRDVIN